MHNVALWTVDNLCQALKDAIGPLEMLPAFAAGHADDALTSIAWERLHGRRKRIAVIARTLATVAWQAQHAVGIATPLSERPDLTADTLMLLCDQALTNAGASEGATLADFQAALAVCVASGALTAAHNGTGYVAVAPPVG